MTATNDLDPRKMGRPPQQPVLNREVYYQGQSILEQGSTGSRAFYIESGRVEINVRDGTHSVQVSELGPGEIFGEMALIRNEARSASVKALEDTTVTVISHSALTQKIDSIQDKAVRALIRVLIDRLANSNKGQIKHYKNFAEFQDRVSSIMEKVNSGIKQDRRNQFQSEVLPLLDRLEALLSEHQK